MPKTSSLRLTDQRRRLPVSAVECLFLILLLFFSTLSIEGMAGQDSAMKSYVRKYRNLAEKKSAQYSIPANVILAVAIVESGSGKTRVAKELHNHFGLVGNNHLKRKSRYKAYPTVEASYDHFCRHLAKKKFYRRLSKSTDNRAWITAISRSGYSERPKVWEQRILRVLKDIKRL